MINNKDNIDNNNTIWNVFIGLFSVLLIVGIVCFASLLILGGLKSQTLVSQTLIKMDIKSLEIKTKINYNWDDIIYINDFNADLLEIIKRKS